MHLSRFYIYLTVHNNFSFGQVKYGRLAAIEVLDALSK